MAHRSSTAWLARCGGSRSAATSAVELTHGPGYDYQPDWSPDGRPHRLRASSRQRDRVVAARCVVRHAQQLTTTECGEPRAALLARWQAARLRVDGRQRSLQSVRRAASTETSSAHARAVVAPRESKIARYYYSKHDHTINPVVDAGRQTSRVRFQSRDRVRHAATCAAPRSTVRASSNASCTKRPAGVRGRKSRPTAGACCTAATRDVSGISCGSRRSPAMRSCR